MKKALVILFMGLGLTSAVPGQDPRSAVEAAKGKLEALQRRIVEFDEESVSIDKRAEVERLQSSIEIKGEFETTQQFEKRKTIDGARIDSLTTQFEADVANARCRLNEETSKILSTTFKTSLDSRGVSLGTYDADRQRFPVLFQGRVQGLLQVPLADAPTLKERLRSAVIVGIVGLGIDGQNRVTEYLPRISITLGEKVYGADFFASLTKERAAEILFGNYDPANRVSTWTPSNDVRENRDTSTITSEPVSLVPMKLGASDFLLFLAKEKDEDSMGCHACGRVVSYAMFEKTPDGWKLQYIVRDAGEYGSWAMLSAPTVRKIGPDKYAFVFSSGSAAMFYDSYFEIGFGCLTHLFTVELGGDDGGSLKVDVKFLPSDKSHFDAVVTTTGKTTVQVGKRWALRPISKVETYRFDGRKYEKADNRK